jgi:hypothetical protein
MPYFDAEKTTRYGLSDAAEPLSLPDFLDQAEALRVVLDELVKLDDASLGDLSDGPPCLQNILAGGSVGEGMRNEVLLNVAIYLKLAKPGSWRADLEELNQRRLRPPVNRTELSGIVGSVGKRDYLYGCSKAPLRTYCDRGACRLRKYGIGRGGDFPTLTGLTKFDTTPPTWFLDVEGGGRIELTTDDLQIQLRFQRRCMDCLNLMPPAIKPDQWRTIVQTLLEKVAVVQVPHDASAIGQLFDLLEGFCTSRAQARAKEEILLGKPWLNAGRHYFRISDFAAYLDRQRFREFKIHKVAQILRDRGATNAFIKIRKKGINLWSVPEFERPSDEELALPDLGEGTPV